MNRTIILLPMLILFCTGCDPSLIKATKAGDASAVKTLLRQGNNQNAHGGYLDQETPLMIAASQGNLPVIEALLEGKARINDAGYRGETALMRAADHGHLDAVKILVERGADVRAKGVQDTTALHYAVQGDRLETARYLLDHGSDINAADRMMIGRTPLGIAAYFGNAHMAQLLIERGADPRPPGNNGRTPAQQARWNGHFGLARMLERSMQGHPFMETAGETPAASNADIPNYQLPVKPSNAAIVIGVRRSIGLPESFFAEHDAEAVRAHLKALGFSPDRIILLTGIEASRASIAKNLESKLPGMIDKNSTVFFFFSGGAGTDKAGVEYLMPSDGDLAYLTDTAYPAARLFQKLSELKSQHVIAVLDCGFSDDKNFPTSSRLEILLATKPGQTANFLPDQGHGAFTYFFLNGLNGAAKDRSGAITVGSLYEYLASTVADAAKKTGKEQTPRLLPANSDEAGSIKLR